uniref:Uncharacterized protein n=1 Tax=Arundo donax TaxID=35708 RepID=A0A0A9GRP2_ARUDO
MLHINTHTHTQNAINDFWGQCTSMLSWIYLNSAQFSLPPYCESCRMAFLLSLFYKNCADSHGFTMAQNG